ncbi:MAG: TIGR00730 family Rossman fold protein [Prevotellaceae bacterium]|jgi:uncharacterized protein (TIGR00730 family)|nr:TIGR00730 family Rossman fold protein [Prevotellaceae bacterium]
MKICVYCASSPSVKEELKEQAKIIGGFIAKNNHILVYGGATGGLMDSVAQAARDDGGQVIGVIPKLLVETGRESNLPSEQIVVEDMNARKAKLKEISDIFIVLPGGYGTLDEFYDTITSGQLGYFDKKIFLVNFKNYFEGTILQTKKMQHENLGYQNRKNNLIVTGDAEETITKIESLE